MDSWEKSCQLKKLKRECGRAIIESDANEVEVLGEVNAVLRVSEVNRYLPTLVCLIESEQTG